MGVVNSGNAPGLNPQTLACGPSVCSRWAAPFVGHDQDKAAAVRGQPELLEIAKSRLKAKDLSKKAGLSDGVPDSTVASHGGCGGQKSDSSGTSRSGQKGGRVEARRQQQQQARQVHWPPRTMAAMTLALSRRMTIPQPYQLERSFWYQRDTQDPAFSESQITAIAPSEHPPRLPTAVYYAASVRAVQTLHAHKPHLFQQQGPSRAGGAAANHLVQSPPGLSLEGARKAVHCMSAKYHLGGSGIFAGAAPEAVRRRPIPALALETGRNLPRV